MIPLGSARLRPLLVGAAAVAVLAAGLTVSGLQRADSATVLGDQAALDAFRAGQAAGAQQAQASESASTASLAPTVPTSPTGPIAPTASDPRFPPPPGTVTTAGTPSPSPLTRKSPAAAPRTGSSTSPQVQPRAPAERDEVRPGVYSYATQGFEQVDALGGARHDYPDSTTVTYARSGCGTSARWQPLKERAGESLECAGADGSELVGSVQQREFFGRSQTERYTCSPGAPLLPRDPQPGRTTRGSCRSGGSRLAVTTTVVGTQSLDVGGTAVPVVHLRVEGTLTGSTRGRSDRDVWLARADGLLVQTDSRTDTDADTEGGTVRYQETYRLRLSSLTPRT